MQAVHMLQNVYIWQRETHICLDFTQEKAHRSRVRRRVIVYSSASIRLFCLITGLSLKGYKTLHMQIAATLDRKTNALVSKDNIYGSSVKITKTTRHKTFHSKSCSWERFVPLLYVKTVEGNDDQCKTSQLKSYLFICLVIIKVICFVQC